jgi:hypothetical protein
MVRKQVYLTVAQDRALKREASALGVAEAELIRRALDVDLHTGASPESSSAGGLEPGAIQSVVAFARTRTQVDGVHTAWKFDREELYEDRRA